ncbi:MAG: phosphoribosylglycinamide formyltransferase [Anaerolineales bacterium]|jgi:phosphoribosylglycinamide formyltransferase-1|nr:phosphoribosylglycinamide formyltransferase [Anaerolineales bacterium]HJO32947.1 phosphoribosylglycinamide formyltransferase [Anaerolineales bacterium]
MTGDAIVPRLVVLVSGNGSNLQAILDACTCGQLAARVVGVFSNRGRAYGLKRAELAGVPGRVCQMKKGRPRREYDRMLAEQVSHFRPDWVVLAGWMRILTSAFLDRFLDRVVNLHPALPGQFPGVNAIERALDAYRKGEIGYTGVMVHLVPDEGVDSGPVLFSERVPIMPNDDLKTLEARVHAVEHRLLVATIKDLCGRDVTSERADLEGE